MIFISVFLPIRVYYFGFDVSLSRTVLACPG